MLPWPPPSFPLPCRQPAAMGSSEAANTLRPLTALPLQPTNLHQNPQPLSCWNLSIFLPFFTKALHSLQEGKKSKQGKIPKHAIKLMGHAPSRKLEVTVTNTETRGPHSSKLLDEHSHGLHLTIRKHFECTLECRPSPLSTAEFGGKINQTENNSWSVLLESFSITHKDSLHCRENSQ